MDSSKNLNSNSFVDRKHFLEDGASVSSDDSGSLFVLILLKVNSGESHQVFIENLGTLLFSEVEAVLPLSALLEHV